VYTLATLRALVADDPSGRMGQTVRLHALPVRQSCFDWVLPVNGICRLAEPALLAAEAGDRGEPLPLAWGDPPQLLALLRRTPMLSSLAPKPQTIDWGTPGVYSIELKRAACVPGEISPCYQAVILDATAA
jgi:hypothetical protein